MTGSDRGRPLADTRETLYPPVIRSFEDRKIGAFGQVLSNQQTSAMEISAPEGRVWYNRAPGRCTT